MKKQLLTAAVAAIALGMAGTGVAQAQSRNSVHQAIRTQPPYSGAYIGHRHPAWQHWRHARANFSRRDIRHAQRRLRAAGLYHGAIDGIIGPRTRRAVAEFQARRGLRPSGRLNRMTMNALVGRFRVGVGSSMPPHAYRPYYGPHGYYR